MPKKRGYFGLTWNKFSTFTSNFRHTDEEQIPGRKPTRRMNVVPEEESEMAGEVSGENFELPIEWYIPDDLVSQYATHIVVQQTPQEFIISFFESDIEQP
jgi:hypothetical protein